MDIIVLSPGATEKELRHIVKKLESRGLQAHISKGTERTIIGVIGDTSKITEEEEKRAADDLLPFLHQVTSVTCAICPGSQPLRLI